MFIFFYLDGNFEKMVAINYFLNLRVFNLKREKYARNERLTRVGGLKPYTSRKLFFFIIDLF